MWRSLRFLIGFRFVQKSWAACEFKFNGFSVAGVKGGRGRLEAILRMQGSVA